MPTYEYKCKDCGEGLEAVQAFTDDPLTECPACGGRLKKVFGSIGISFKGSGFYKTDARSGSSGSSSNGSGTADAAASSGDSSSTTSDGATKTADKSDKPDKKSETTKA